MQKSDGVPAEVAPAVSAAVQKLHDDLVTEIHKRELSASENFDKSILTLSSGGLAVSIGFLKDFVPIQSASQPWALYVSWIAFVGATAATTVSFLVSGYSQVNQKERAYRYYILGEQAAFNKPNQYDTWITRLNIFSAAAFLIALVLTIIFISINLEKGSAMKPAGTSPLPVAVSPLGKGLTAPSMQKIPTVAPQPATNPGATATPATPTPSPAKP